MRLSGDSLGVADPRKFEKVAKLLRFKHRDRIMIDHMDVELMVRDSRLDLFPFMFDIDRYRFGVSGSNDLGLNLDYHIAVLKSPIPFRFGVNIKGRPGHVRFSLGRAHFDEKKALCAAGAHRHHPHQSDQGRSKRCSASVCARASAMRVCST